MEKKMDKFILAIGLFLSVSALASIEKEVDLERFDKNKDWLNDTWTGLVWEDTPHTEAHSYVSNNYLVFSEAKLYCKNLVLGKKKNFRLPTYPELEYLSVIKHQIKYKSPVPYWSSTFIDDTRIRARYLKAKGYLGNPNHGKPFYQELDGKLTTRCVAGHKYNNLNSINKRQELVKREKIKQKSQQYYKIAESKNTIDAYRRYISNYPDSHLVADAKTNVLKIQQALFLKAKQDNTVSGYLKFLDTIPSLQQKNDALDAIYALVQEKNTIVDYEDFIKTHPNSKQAKSAITNIFEFVENKNNISGFEWFVNKYPNSSHVQEAIQSIHTLAFNKAKTINTISAYNTFIITYPTANQVNNAQDLAYKLEVTKYTNFGMFDSIFNKDSKMEKSARKLLIKAKQIERNGNNYSGDAKFGYILVTNRMYLLLQEKFDDSDATLRHLESQEFKDFVQEFKRAMRTVNDRLSNIARYSKEIIEVSKKGFADADADRAMADYKLDQHESWEKYMHFRDKGYN